MVSRGFLGINIHNSSCRKFSFRELTQKNPLSCFSYVVCKIFFFYKKLLKGNILMLEMEQRYLPLPKFCNTLPLVQW